ncbi:hypothetical protein [Chitinophaga sp. GbtcB8]|uniref:hypothetical protein n=1 Tax=Chitinophaga sp. GbtcB8 TaxID=2824753 RepID=UPI001C306D8A|nr:hypothetical protein [Chitinophaga sp. GbtcB8]
MPQNPIPQPNSKSASLTEQSVRDFIELQKEELRLRHQENSLKQLELQHSYELSKESLKQQGEYIKAAPKHDFKNRAILIAFFIIIFLIVAGVLIYCINLDKEEIALRILEIVSTAIISAGGGYAWGKSKGLQKEQSKIEVME